MADIVDEGGEAERASVHVEDGLRHLRAAHHVHVHTALNCARISGSALKSTIVHSTSHGHTKRMLRDGRAIVPSAMSFAIVRATSRIVAQPLALSFAPGTLMIEVAAQHDLLAARSVPGMSAVTGL